MTCTSAVDVLRSPSLAGLIHQVTGPGFSNIIRCPAPWRVELSTAFFRPTCGGAAHWNILRTRTKTTYGYSRTGHQQCLGVEKMVGQDKLLQARLIVIKSDNSSGVRHLMFLSICLAMDQHRCKSEARDWSSVHKLRTFTEDGIRI